MHLLRTCLLTLCTVGLLAASATPAIASPQGDKLHKQALVAAQAGSYVKAKRLWEKAYRLDQEPKYLYNLGLIAEESDKPLEALTYYERFLKKAPDEQKYRKLRVKAQARVKGLLQRVATIEIVATQIGVKVFVDQRSVGLGPLRTSLRVAQGDHLVVATLAGHHGQTHKLKLFGGQNKKLTLRLLKIQTGKMRYPLPRWLPWTILGTGLAIVVAGVVPMVLQVDAYQKWNDSIDPDFYPTGIASLKQKADRLWASGIGLLVGGGVVAAGGLIAALLNRPKLTVDKSKNEPKTVETLIGPGSVALRIRF